MDAHLYGSQMVRQHSDAYRLSPRRHLFIYWGDEPLIQILDGLQLQFQITVVTCLVARLYVYEYEVIVLKRLQGSLRLAFVVGVSQSCGTFHLNNLQPRIVADAANQVYSRDDAAALHLRILRHQRLHRGTIAATPRPDAVSLALSALGTCDIEGMLCQQVLRLQNQLVQQVGSLLGG